MDHQDYHQRKLQERGRIIGMRESGMTPTAIARQLGISRNTVYYWITRWEEEGNLKDHHRSGAPKSTTPEQDQAIQDYVESHPLRPATAIREALALDVCARTVRRRLHSTGVHHRTPAVKENLTER